MSVNNSQVCLFAPELIGAMTGAAVTLGPLLYEPVQLIFDNQSTSAVVIAVNGVNWHTFPAGEAIVLDLRCQQGKASNFSPSIGTIFTATGAATGSFSISYTYAKDGAS